MNAQQLPIEVQEQLKSRDNTKDNSSILTLASAIVFNALSLSLFFYVLYGQHKSIAQIPDTKEHILGIETQKQAPGLPMRLKIPKINVNTTIESVGILDDGTMGIPQKAINVGWFELGPRPGENGSAVVAGHVDGRNGEAAVFTDLNKLQPGDTLSVEDEKGISTTFVVREKRTYDPGYADEVFNQTDSSYLNLITCDGEWDRAKESYSKRLVVFTDRRP